MRPTIPDLRDDPGPFLTPTRFAKIVLSVAALVMVATAALLVALWVGAGRIAPPPH